MPGWQGLAEGLHFADGVGLDPQQVVNVVSQGAARSRGRWIIATKPCWQGGIITALPYWMGKDLAIAMTKVEQQSLPLSVAKMVDGFYVEVQQMGGGRWNTSSLLARLQQMKK